MNTPSAPSPHWQPQTESHVINMREEEERQERTVRFWLWMALGLCGLALVAILGGYAFGNGILRGSHLREQFSMGLTEEAARAPGFGVHEQGSNLLGRQPGQSVRYYSGPSELAMAASRGEVVIDEDGVMHEVELERLAAMEMEDALRDEALALKMIPEALPPMPHSQGLLASDIAAPDGGETMAMASNRPLPEPAYSRRGNPEREDVFFGQ